MCFSDAQVNTIRHTDLLHRKLRMIPTTRHLMELLELDKKSVLDENNACIHFCSQLFTYSRFLPCFSSLVFTSMRTNAPLSYHNATTWVWNHEADLLKRNKETKVLLVGRKHYEILTLAWKFRGLVRTVRAGSLVRLGEYCSMYVATSQKVLPSHAYVHTQLNVHSWSSWYHSVH